MMPSKSEIRRKSRSLNRRDMVAWLEETAGKSISAAQFDKLMRETLPPEQAYQTEIIRYIETIPGAFAWKAAAGPYSRRGIPDICAVIDGHFFGFEVKRPYIGVVSKIQHQTIMQIRAAGGTAAVISFKEQAKEIIEKWTTDQ